MSAPTTVTLENGSNPSDIPLPGGDLNPNPAITKEPPPPQLAGNNGTHSADSPPSAHPQPKAATRTDHQARDEQIRLNQRLKGFYETNNTPLESRTYIDEDNIRGGQTDMAGRVLQGAATPDQLMQYTHDPRHRLGSKAPKDEDIQAIAYTSPAPTVQQPLAAQPARQPDAPPPPAQGAQAPADPNAALQQAYNNYMNAWAAAHAGGEMPPPPQSQSQGPAISPEAAGLLHHGLDIVGATALGFLASQGRGMHCPPHWHPHPEPPVFRAVQFISGGGPRRFF